MSGALGRIHAIARNTFVEAYRNRAFLGLSILAVLLVIASLLLSQLAIRDQAKRVVIDFGQFAISLLSVITAVVLGVILIFKEIDRKTFYLIIPKPIHRHEVILGKYLGLMEVLFIVIIVMGASWFVAMKIRDCEINQDMAKALLLVLFEASIVVSVALFFSSFATPIMSGIFTFGFYLVGCSTSVLQDILRAKKGAIVTSQFLRGLAKAIVYVFPDLGVFNVSKEIILDVPVTWDYVFGCFLYSLGYSLFFILLAILVFRRREFN
jgi:ABC-type transport system involved in multi-copper enzyme maturation permease subunit